MLPSLLRKLVIPNFVARENCLTTKLVAGKRGYCCKKDDKDKSKEKDKEKNQQEDISQLIRHNFHQECEEGLNEQINCELYASYTYFCMANCLSRPDVALLGFARYFSAASHEERVHAQKFVDFVNMRGGTVQLCDVLKPETADYHCPETALEESIHLEKNVLKSIEELHKKAMDHNDILLTDFLESEYIPEQYKGLQQLAELLSQVRRAGPGPGLIILDLDLRRSPPPSHGLHKVNGTQPLDSAH